MENPAESHRHSGDQGPLLDLSLLWRKKFQLVLFTALAVGLGAVYLAVVDRSYEVTARLLIEPQREVLDTGRPTPKDSDFLPTQAEIIRSPTVIRRAIEQLPVVNLAALGVDASSSEAAWSAGPQQISAAEPATESLPDGGNAGPSGDEAAIAAEDGQPDASQVVTVRRPNPYSLDPFGAPGRTIESKGVTEPTGDSSDQTPPATATGDAIAAADQPPVLPSRGMPTGTKAMTVSGTELPAAVMQRTVVKVLDKLDVEPLLGTHVLSLQFQAYDKDQALAMLSSVIASYREFLQDRERSSHQEVILLLADRERELREEIARLHREFERMHSLSPLLGRDEQAAEAQRASLTKLAELVSTTKQRRIQLENYRSELAVLREREQHLADQQPPSSEPTTMVGAAASGLDSAALTLQNQRRAAADLLSRMSREGVVSLEDPVRLQEALSEALVREAELDQKFGERHPEIRAVRGLIRSLRDRIDQSVLNAPQMVDRELQSVRDHEARLTSAYEEEFDRVKEVDGFLLREQQALSEVERVQAVHDTVVTQLHQLDLADEAVSGGRPSVSVRILDGPVVDTDQTWPKPLPLLALCAVVGACGGFVFVSASERLGEFAGFAARRRA